VIDFGSLEVQAVYISGNMTGPFSAYLENQHLSLLGHKPSNIQSLITFHHQENGLFRKL